MEIIKFLMKKSSRKSFIIFGIIFGTFLLLFIGFGIKMKLETGKMIPLESKKVTDNILSIKDSYVNMFLIEDEEGYIAIDAGKKIKTIKEEFGKLKIDPDKVIAVLLTHSDADHVAAIELFANAKIYLSRQEEQMINGETYRFWSIGKNSISSNNYTLIDDQQILNIGNTKIQGILTPGHTPGSMCYSINNKYLFTGDALSLNIGRIARFNDFFNMETETAVKSLGKLTNIPGIIWIFTAHYGCTDDYQNAVNNWKN